MTATPATTTDPWVGSTLAETYRIVRPIGEGGMGAVYEAEHARLPRRFAIKVLRADYLKTGQWVERFRREAEIASQLRHPHIVEVVDYNHAPDGRPYIVMEFLAGEDLAERLERGPLSQQQSMALLSQVAAGLSVAHRRGVIHRDLKPQNIFLARESDDEPVAKILDFGIAKLTAQSGALTSDNIVLGTPWYISPEQVLGKRELVDARSDLFSFAVIAYQLLLGRAPFASDSVAATLHQVAYDAPPAPTELDPSFPEDAEDVLLRGLSKDRDERYLDARRFVEALAATLEGEPIPRGLRAGASAGPPSRMPTAPAVDEGANAALAETQIQPFAATTADISSGDRKRKILTLYVVMTVLFTALFAGGLLLFGERKSDRERPEPAAKPADKPATKPAAEPRERPAAKPTAKPEPATKPKPAATPKPATKPRPKPTATPKPVAKPKPKPVAKPRPKPTPRATPSLERNQRPKPTAKPEPKPTAKPEAKPEPKPKPKPAPPRPAPPKPTPKPATKKPKSDWVADPEI